MAAHSEEGVLSQFDFSAIEEMDPSLSGGNILCLACALDLLSVAS